MVLSFILLLFGVTFSKKCDKYVSGSVWIHKGGAADETASFEGCKKGCYWNETYNDDGIPKCEKCSEISDEMKCSENGFTCQWTKNGKCKSQSCPNLAKNLNVDNSAYYRQCVEGSPLENYFNDLYLKNFQAHYDETVSIATGNCDYSLPGILETWVCNVNTSLNPQTYLYGGAHNCTDKLAGYGFPQPQLCRVLPSVRKQLCIDYYMTRNVHIAGIDPKSFYEKCEYDEGRKPSASTPYSSDDYKRVYGYSIADNCKLKRDEAVKNCESVYNTYITTNCREYFSAVNSFNHAQTMQHRAICHQILGCMYSKINERCSVWAVWAYVLALVLSIVVVLVVFIVICFLLFSTMKQKKSPLGA